MIANNLEEFTIKLTNAICNGLNSEKGKPVNDIMVSIMPHDNSIVNAPDAETMKERVKSYKSDLVLMIFISMLKEYPELMHEYAMHMRNDILAQS